MCDTEFGRQLGGGLFEVRLRQDAEEVLRRVGKSLDTLSQRESAVFLRVFCHAYGERVVLLLGGYDKGRDPNLRRQQREIEVPAGDLLTFVAALVGLWRFMSYSP